MWITDAEYDTRRVVEECTQLTWYVDADGDGFGDDTQTIESCTEPSGSVLLGGDCNDEIADINPETQWFFDADLDGFGDPSTVVSSCTPPEGAVREGGDCDDGEPLTNPGAEEDCDLAGDQDCDGDFNDPDALNCALFYADGDSDNFGDGLGQCQCQPSDEYPVLVDGDCDDDDPAISPSAEEICNDQIDNNCDGSAAGCRPEDDTVLSSDALIQVIGPSSQSFLGGQAATLDDRLVLTSSGTSSRGVVHILDVPSSAGTVGVDDGITISGVTDSGGFGGALAIADIDGDGNTDLATSAPFIPQGEAFWFAGPFLEDLTAADAQVVLKNDGGTDRLGAALALGDVTDDGQLDWLVSAFADQAVYVFTSTVTGDIAPEDATIELFTELQDVRTGFSLAIANDLDGDGVPEVVIGADRSNLGDRDAGAVYVVSGPLSDGSFNLAADADWVVFGLSQDGNFGASLSALGDVTGNGLSDVLIGAPGADEAYVLPSGVAPGTYEQTDLPVRIQGPNGSALGTAVGDLGDVDGDGVADVGVGAPTAGVGGAAWVFYGPLEGTLVEADWAITGTSGERAGSAVIGLGDQNGDNYADLLVGASSSDVPSTNTGAAWLIFGEGL
ncbi:MAG: MopE-related protein [Myxococcota bacterium]